MSPPTTSLLPSLPGRLASLAECALDLRGLSACADDALWGTVDPEIWARTRNSWLILQSLSRARIDELAADDAFCARLEAQVRGNRELMQRPGWFTASYPRAPLASIAYFSMEFGLSEALPIYAGGLGILAGDYLKAASDLGVPLVGIGLLYRRGYFRQVIDASGAQLARHPYNDPAQLPIRPVLDPDGDWTCVTLDFPGRAVHARAWEVRVGRIRLLLLDTNVAINTAGDRGITGELYNGGPELRLQQEIVLGIGGYRLLQCLDIDPEVCHLNEGHAAFVVLERARALMQQRGLDFETAFIATRAANLFTTHTAVAAGFDRFERGLVRLYLEDYARELGIDFERLLALGRARPLDPDEPFQMPYLALRGAGAVNGVSKLHGQISRRIFQNLFPRWPEAEVPVGSVTNGVHVPTWESAAADRIWQQACGPERWYGALETVERDMRCVCDEELWRFRTTSRIGLIDHARARLAEQFMARGASRSEVESAASEVLDGKVLTLGFARRFASYKRPHLLLHDPERLMRLLTHPERPVQLIVAGKAHPQDEEGRELVRQWVRFVRRPEVRHRAVFLADYDMLLAERLVQGVDVWINTPRRPWEASGTSGMKVLANGGLNLSELDGWWAEANALDVGWALGDEREHGADPGWDASEAEQLYAVLEREIVPTFYERDAEGIPRHWLARMRESMARLTPRFSTNRMLREYTEMYYLPAAAAWRRRAADQGKLAKELGEWGRRCAELWPALRFGALRVEARGDRHRIEVEVFLGSLLPESVCVELYADAHDGAERVCQRMSQTTLPSDPVGYHLYAGEVPASRSAHNYTPRVRAHHSDASVPLEAPVILWYS